MKSLFNPADREHIVRRIEALAPDSVRAWGKMTSDQMLCHCANALESGSGDRPMRQAWIGRLLAPLVRRKALGNEPFGRNSPTDPTFVASGSHDFAQERRRLLVLIERFAERGPSAAGTQVHPFFGALTGDEWGRLMYKHIDHHLTQFGL